MHILFKKRRSVRSFTSKEVTDEQVKQILTAAMVAPSGKNIRPFEFLVIRDKKTRERLGNLRVRGRYVIDAPVTIAIIGKEKESNLWLQDCSLAAAHVYLEATNQDLATCWVNGIGSQTDDGRDAEKVYKEILGVPDDVRLLGLFPIGHPAEKIQNHGETEYNEKKVHKEKW